MSGFDSPLQAYGIENIALDKVVRLSLKLGGLLGLFYRRTFLLGFFYVKDFFLGAVNASFKMSFDVRRWDFGGFFRCCSIFLRSMFLKLKRRILGALMFEPRAAEKRHSQICFVLWLTLYILWQWYLCRQPEPKCFMQKILKPRLAHNFEKELCQTSRAWLEFRAF